MAYSYATWTGSKGAGDEITVSFPYLSEDHVRVLVDDVEVSSSLYQWTSSSVIECLAGFPSGAAGRVERVTPRNDMPSQQQGSGSFDWRGANENDTYLLYIQQEVDDSEAERQAVTDDLVAQFEDIETNAGIAQTAADTATTKAGEAATSETNAAGSATTASGAATTATTKAGEAAASASSASTSEANAASSASTATTKAGEAATSASSAAASEDAAATSATNAATSEVNAAASESIASTKALEASLSASEGAMTRFEATPQYDPEAADNTHVIFSGGGTTHRHFGGIVLAGRNTLVGAHRKADGHGIEHEGEIVAWTSPDGGATISSEVTVEPSEVGRDKRGPVMGVSPLGTVLLGINDTPSDGGGDGPTYFKVRRSTGSGESWSDPILIDTVAADYGRLYGTIKARQADTDVGFVLTLPAYIRVSSTEYEVTYYESADDGLTWTKATNPIYEFTSGVGDTYTECDIAWLNAECGIAVIRGDLAYGMGIWKTENAGAGWAFVGAVKGTVGEDAVAPAVYIIHSEGVPYVFVVYCERSGDVSKVRYARYENAVTTDGTDFELNSCITSSSDMVNASGYQKWAIYPNGNVLMVEFKEYTGDASSDVRLVRLAPLRWTSEGLLEAWTPTILGATATGAPSYTSQVGYLRRSGTGARVWGEVQLSTKTEVAGQIRMAGLPVRVRNLVGVRSALNIGFATGYDVGAGYIGITGRAIINSFGFELFRVGQVGSGSLLDSHIDADFAIIFDAWIELEDP